MGDLKTFVKKTVYEVLKEEYPMLEFAGCEIGCVKEVHNISGKYCYTVRILDTNGQEDRNRSEMPGLVSDQAYNIGEQVVILYVYGTRPYIAGRWME